jgi:tRNA threonylcarbamoyladenosine biosynthesis protein TsaB
MKILAIETTERIGSVALAEDRKLLSEKRLDSTKRSAQSLAPAIRQILDEAGWKPVDVELVATTIGPGSFTGLRVGVTTAKTFAYCVQAEVLGVDTLETIASAVPPEVGKLAVAIDAQRGEVVAAVFERDRQGRMRPAGEAAVVEIDRWLESLEAGAAVAGPVLARLHGRLPDRVSVVPEQYWRPTAAAVALLAGRHHREGRRDDLWNFVPRYSRRSAAEEKWDALGR